MNRYVTLLNLVFVFQPFGYSENQYVLGNKDPIIYTKYESIKDSNFKIFKNYTKFTEIKDLKDLMAYSIDLSLDVTLDGLGILYKEASVADFQKVILLRAYLIGSLLPESSNKINVLAMRHKERADLLKTEAGHFLKKVQKMYRCMDQTDSDFIKDYRVYLAFTDMVDEICGKINDKLDK